MPQHGSVQNHLYANANPGAPKVGDGATIIYWSDRHAATVVEVSKTGATVKVQTDKVTYDANGYADEANIERDPEGSVLTFTRRKGGKYVLKGDRSHGGLVVLFGARKPYYDRSF